MSMLIFLPQTLGVATKRLTEIGLDDLVAGAEFMDVASGPDGDRGALVVWRTPSSADKRFACVPDKQQWSPAFADGDLPAKRFWVGTWLDRPPRPADLRRSQLHRGSMIELGDGNLWEFPDASELTRDILFDPDGTMRLEIQPRLRPIWDEAVAWRDRLANAAGGSDGAKAKVSYSEVLTFLIKMLRMNYRVVPELVSQLRLFNTSNLSLPMLAVLGANQEIAADAA